MKSTGRKRRFGVAGTLNVLVTNICLQLLLLLPALPTWLCTLISQLINASVGYIVYGKWVFKARGLRSGTPAFRWGAAQFTLWSLNWIAIIAGTRIGMHRNITAALLVPILALISYNLQKRWIFRLDEA